MMAIVARRGTIVGVTVVIGSPAFVVMVVTIIPVSIRLRAPLVVTIVLVVAVITRVLTEARMRIENGVGFEGVTGRAFVCRVRLIRSAFKRTRREQKSGGAADGGLDEAEKWLHGAVL